MRSESHSTATAHMESGESGARAGGLKRSGGKQVRRGGAARAAEGGKAAGGAGARKARHGSAHSDSAAAASANADPSAARLPPAIAHLFPDGRMHLPDLVTPVDFAAFCEAKCEVLQVCPLLELNLSSPAPVSSTCRCTRYTRMSSFESSAACTVDYTVLCDDCVPIRSQTMHVTSPRIATTAAESHSPQQSERLSGVKEPKRKQQRKRKPKPSADGAQTQPSGGDEESTTQSSAVADSSSVRSTQSHSHSTCKQLEVSPGGGVPLRFPPAIAFGKWDIKTWYSAPYPQEYARCAPLRSDPCWPFHPITTPYLANIVRADAAL